MTKKPDLEIEEVQAKEAAKAAPAPAKAAKKADEPRVPESALRANRVFGAPLATGQGKS